MNFRWRNRYFTFYIGVNRIEHVDGVNSKLGDGQHFLMWDFDEVWEPCIEAELLIAQQKHNLPPIYVFSSGAPGCYHAYCFASFPWEDACAIIAGTPYVDKKYVSIGILRGLFTLRYSEVRGKKPEPIMVLPSLIEADVDPMKLKSFVTYPKKRR